MNIVQYIYGLQYVTSNLVNSDKTIFCLILQFLLCMPISTMDHVLCNLYPDEAIHERH